MSRTASNSVYNWPAPAADTVPNVPNGRNQYTSIDGAAQSYDARGNLSGDDHLLDCLRRETSFTIIQMIVTANDTAHSSITGTAYIPAPGAA